MIATAEPSYIPHKSVASQLFMAQREPVEEPSMERVLLTAEETAECLKVGRCKVYDLIRSGELESFKIGRLRRIPVASVQAFAKRMLAGDEL